MTQLSEVLSGVRHLAIDTGPFIYLVESHSQFAPVIRSVVRRAEQGELSLVSSVLTLTEVLTRPFAEGAHDLVDSYRELLLGSPYLQIWAATVSKPLGGSSCSGGSCCAPARNRFGLHRLEPVVRGFVQPRCI